MELESTSPSSSSSASTNGREGNSSGRYPDVVLQQRGAEISRDLTNSNSSRPRRCSYCNKSSFNSCSCSFQSNNDHRTTTVNKGQVVGVGEVTVAIDNSTADFVKVVSEQYDESGRKIFEPVDDKRKWEYFPGKNKFYFDGRLMTAPSIRFCMLSFFLILVTFVLFTVFDGPFLAARLTIAIPIIGSILFFLVIVNMLKTSCSDPGILPRASAQESEFIEKSYANPNGLRPPPRTKDIIVNGQTIKSKYCFTCKMFRPPRASHCGVCDNCVDRFDHHCPFLGNCIGKRNYRNFYTFIVSLSLLAVFVLSCSITKLALLGKDKGNFLEALRESPTSAIVILISFLGMWTVIGLAGFHTYLIAVEQTTNEDLKGMFGRANAVNPYTRGNFCQNCCFILCGPHQPSLIDSRGIVTSDFLASLPKKSGGHDTISTAPCNPPTSSIRPHCGEGSNTPRNEGVQQTSYQIPTLESGSHKLGQGNINPTMIQTSASSTNRNISREDLMNNKAATVPGSVRSPAQKSITSGGIPSVSMSHTNSTSMGDGGGGRGSKSQKLGGGQTKSKSQTQIQKNSSKEAEEHISLSMDELDEYSSYPAALRNHHKAMVMSTSAPLISSNPTKQQQQYERNFQNGKDVISNGHSVMNNGSSGGGVLQRNGNPPRNVSIPTSTSKNFPVALAFDEDEEFDEEDAINLENLTMINSPLHLDSIS